MVTIPNAHRPTITQEPTGKKQRGPKVINNKQKKEGEGARNDSKAPLPTKKKKQTGLRVSRPAYRGARKTNGRDGIPPGQALQKIGCGAANKIHFLHHGLNET